jgi:ethanolamine utilization protein EutP
MPDNPHIAMKTIVLIGRTGCGKTMLASRLAGVELDAKKTAGAVRVKNVIDTPGGFAENRFLGGALSVFAYEAQVVGLIIAADEPFSLYPPNIHGMLNREMIGIVTKTDIPAGSPQRAEGWLRLAGCKRVFHVSALTGQGIDEIMEYLK